MLLVCDAGYVGYDLFGLLLKQQCSFLIRLSSQAQLYSLEMVKVEGFTEGEFWYWTDDAENQRSRCSQRAHLSGVGELHAEVE